MARHSHPEGIHGAGLASGRESILVPSAERPLGNKVVLRGANQSHGTCVRRVAQFPRNLHARGPRPPQNSKPEAQSYPLTALRFFNTAAGSLVLMETLSRLSFSSDATKILSKSKRSAGPILPRPCDALNFDRSVGDRASSRRRSAGKTLSAPPGVR